MAHKDPFINLTLESLLPVLISAWEAEGNPVSLDVHLQLRRLANNVPPGTPLERFKTMIAPLLTKDQQQQADFYRVFDSTLNSLEQNELAFQKIIVEEKVKWRKQAVLGNIGKKYRKLINFIPVPNKYVPGIFLALLIGVSSFFTVKYFKSDKNKKLNYTIRHNINDANHPVRCFRVGKVRDIRRVEKKYNHVVIKGEELVNDRFCIQFSSNGSAG